jgi:hypothetical protein
MPEPSGLLLNFSYLSVATGVRTGTPGAKSVSGRQIVESGEGKEPSKLNLRPVGKKGSAQPNRVHSANNIGVTMHQWLVLHWAPAPNPCYNPLLFPFVGGSIS